MVPDYLSRGSSNGSVNKLLSLVHFDLPYLFKRVIVTPAVYPRLVESLRIDIQSTGQKSHRVSANCRASRCFVSIKRSDSPGPYQFLAGRSAAATSGPPRERTRRAPASRPAGARSPRRSAQRRRPAEASPRPRAGDEAVSPRPDPKSQSFSRSYGSVLPTSLTHVRSTD